MRHFRRFSAQFEGMRQGHHSKKGEIQRLEELRAWAREAHAIAFEYRGATWVRQCLLRNPELRPDLFENLPDAISAAKREILQRLDSTTVDPGRIDQLEEQIADRLRVLLAEARVHHGRAREFGDEQQFAMAIRSWDDALRLVRGHGSAPVLEGEILAVLSGVQVLVGDLVAAETNARRAQELLGDHTSSPHYWWAVGNLAFLLSHTQNYAEARVLFGEVLNHYESEANIVEIARTIQQMAELAVQTKDTESALELGERLRKLNGSIVQAIGHSQLTIGFIGTAGQAYMLAADSLEPPTSNVLRGNALETFSSLRDMGAETGLVRLELIARAQIGFCLWHMDHLEDAETILREVVSQGDSTYAKVLADAQFNHSMVLNELNRHDEAVRTMNEARRRYREIGDLASMQDAEKKLNDWNRGA
jgi:tetratricopeptide (TPR) repeat protein